MIENESALDLFQRLHINDEQRCPTLIDRLNRSFHFFFPNKRNERAELIEFISKNRHITDDFLHQFLFDYFQYVDDQDDLLRQPFQKRFEHSSNSPRANKDSVESDVPVLQTTFNGNRSITFFYIDTESRECPFDHRRIHWFDCSTSTELISTFCLLEKFYLSKCSNEHFVFIVNSTSQIVINDYFRQSNDDVISIEESKKRTIEWQRLLSRLLIDYRLSCILIEQIDLFSPIFDLITSKRNNKTRDNSSFSLSEYAFGRLMLTEENERLWKNQIDYRQIFALPSE